jgi:2-polyprenyl-3-methyl-5-hydroxy-6-metoxy-1,4-benzoquinol methylase
MIEAAVRLHTELAGRITLATVPLRDSDSLLSRQFRAVVCIGTIIHMPDQYLFEFASQIRDLVAPDGILFLSGSIRNLPSQETRDQQGRLIIERVPEEIQLLFERLGFQLLTRVQND